MTVPINENSLAAKVRREALGISRRAVNHKLSVDRGLTAGDLMLAAEAVDRRAAELANLAADLREMIA